MKTRLFIIGFLALCICSCNRSKSTSGQPEADAKQANSASDASAADDKGTFWELPDKSDLRVITTPWPPKAGAATLKAEATADDDGGKFTGTIAYRITTNTQSSVAWQPMPKVREDKDKSVYFESPITLSQGSVYIQFRVHGAGEQAFNKQYVDLTDWQIEVK